MIVEKTTSLNSIEIGAHGVLQLRLKKLVRLDGEVMKEEWHRTAIPPNIAAADQLEALRLHLAELGFDGLPGEQEAIVLNAAATVHTPEVVAAYEAMLVSEAQAQGGA